MLIYLFVWPPVALWNLVSHWRLVLKRHVVTIRWSEWHIWFSVSPTRSISFAWWEQHDSQRTVRTLNMPTMQAVRKKKNNLCILVRVYSISGQHIDFFDFQTNRSLQCKKIQFRLHRESCFHVELEVLLTKLLAYRIYLPTKERTQCHDFETFNGRGMTVYSKWKNVITFTDRSVIWPGTVVTCRRGSSDPLIRSITCKSNLIAMPETPTPHVRISWSGQLDTRS